MSPESASPPTTLPPRLKLWAMATQWLLALLLSCALLLGLGWALLHWVIVPRIDEFRPALERLARQATGLHLEIGQLEARSSGLIPSFALRQVRLLDAQGQAALQLPQVLISLSPRSVIQLGLEQLVIEGAELSLRRTADGRFVIAGIDVSQAPQVDVQPALDWLFAQSEWALLGGTVRWQDDMQGIGVQLQQVDWVMRNSGQRHSMRLDATPQAQWGDRFSLRGQLRQPLLSVASGRWRQWSGQLYGEFSRIEAAPLQAYGRLAGIELERGRGALRAWLDVDRGRIVGALADVQLQEVQVRLAAKLPSLALRSVGGRLGWQETERGLQASAQALNFESDDGLRWPAGNVSWTQQAGANGAPGRGQFSADQIDLAALSAIALRLPMAPALHEQLRSLQPQGQVEALQLSWQGSLEQPERAELSGRVRQLALSPGPSPARGPGRPGMQGADVDFEWTHAKNQDSGRAAIKMNKGWLEFPGVFEEPRVPLEQFGAQIRFKRSATASLIEVEDGQLQATDAQGQFKGSWSRQGEGLGQLDLQGELSRGNGARVYRYLPLGVSESVRRYVQEAVPQGQLSEVRFKVKGPLARFPFKQADEGEFLISGKLRNALYHYVPSAGSATSKPWPALEQLEADLLFQRAGMQISNARAQVAGFSGLAVSRAQARMADMTAQPSVEVTGEIRGPLAQGLQLVKASPLAAMTREVLSPVSASGPAELQLKLQLPLRELARSTVAGQLLLTGNDVQWGPQLPALAQARGAVNFTQDSVQVSNAQARLLGGDLRFEGSVKPRTADGAEPEVQFKGQGQVSAEALQQLPALEGLARYASGSTSYSATVGLRQGWVEASISSPLRGLQLNLPEPLNKPAGADWPLRLERVMVPASLQEGRRPQDQINLQLSPGASLPGGLSLSYVRDLSGTKPQVLAGDLAVGAPALEPAPGQVRAQVDLPSLDLDAWDRLADGLTDQLTDSGGPLLAQGYLPSLLSVRSGQVRLQGHQIQQLVLGASRDRSLWRANVDASGISGYGEYRPASGSTAGRLYARLSRLSLGQGSTNNVEALLDNQPASIPALDIVVDDLELRGRKLGRLEVEAINRNSGGGEAAREWRLAKLNLSVPEARLTATGSWAAPNGEAAARGPARPAGPMRRQTQMNFQLDVSDSGELLKRMGMDGAIRRGKGKLEGRIGWNGSPLALHTPSLNGQFNVDVESGQFLKAEPGVAKLLGVLSLQALPRRLALDFRDVFSEGFSFDWVRGEVAIEQGVASTNNLRMKGVNAAVLMAGSADITRETQELRVVVVPEINAGTASLLASAINPAVALGTFVAQWLLRRPLSEANTREFTVRGTWADSVIERVARTPAPAPANASP
jgi:uncharacterized protein (TIGR02099 family)